MSKQLKGFLFLSVFLISQVAFACSCEHNYFCDKALCDEPGFEVAIIRVKIIDKIVYQDENNTNAVYLELIESYKDDVGVGNFIKLYGDNQTADCSIDTRGYSLFSEYILTIGIRTDQYEIGEYFENPIPDDASYWEFAPSSCHFATLRIENGTAIGSIKSGIPSYPLEQFGDRVENCDFNFAELNEYRCADDDYIVYPNPSFDGNITIRNNYKRLLLKEINVFDINGRLIMKQPYIEEYADIKKLKIIHKGLFFVEIICGENKYVRRVLVQ